MTAPRLLWITPPAGPLDAMGSILAALTPSIRSELAVLLRRPHASARAVLAEAQHLRTLGVRLLLHRRVDLAQIAGADGVHLPERGLDPREVRRLWPSACLGVSRHDRAGLGAAAEVADYATLSPFAETEDKGPPLGPKGFRAARAGVALPVLALGGVNPTTAPLAAAAGADGFAFIRAGFKPQALTAMAQALPSPP